MNQGKLEVVKQEMARVNIDILGISELKWTGMGDFNSDDHYIYYCGQKSLRRNGVALIDNKKSKMRLLLSHFSRVRLFATPWTAAYQAPPSMGFSRQKYWSGVPLPSLILGCNLKNDRMISARCKGKPFNITVIQVYAPTTNAYKFEVGQFYEDL